MSNIFLVLRRSRFHILTFGLVYLLTVLGGALMVHQGSRLALNTRDKLVAKARGNDRASIAYAKGKRFEAALWDFGQNVAIGAVPQTLMGLTVVTPYAIAAYRGWIGGIVSVDGQHQSRLRKWKKAAYYILTLLLQLIPYSLTGGVGVKLGLSYFRADPAYMNSRKVMGYPVEALKDVARVYAVAVPLFLIASLWEFLSTWN